MGFDSQGCEQLEGRLKNTKKWIGATEIVAFLTSRGIRTELLDFHAPTSSDGCHPRLFQWVLGYFKDHQGRNGGSSNISFIIVYVKKIRHSDIQLFFLCWN